MNAFGKSAGGGRRTAPREVTPLLAVYTSVTRSHSALLVDVSNTGARLRAPELPEAGEDLLVSLSNIGSSELSHGSVMASLPSRSSRPFQMRIWHRSARLWRAGSALLPTSWRRSTTGCSG